MKNKHTRIIEQFQTIGKFENKSYEKPMIQQMQDIQNNKGYMRNYWWPEIKDNIKKYIQRCTKYQQNKMQYMKKAGEFYPLEIIEGPQ